MNKKLLVLIAMMLVAASFAAEDLPDEDSNPTSTLLDTGVLGNFESSSNSDDMDAAGALLSNVRDLEYEDDEDMSPNDEEGMRRSGSNGMVRRLPQKLLTNKTGYICDPSFLNCMVVADTALIPSSYSEITGIVLGCVVAVGGAIVLGLAWYKYKRRQSRCSNSKEEAADDDDDGTYVSSLTQEALEMEVI